MFSGVLAGLIYASNDTIKSCEVSVSINLFEVKAQKLIEQSPSDIMSDFEFLSRELAARARSSKTLEEFFNRQGANQNSGPDFKIDDAFSVTFNDPDVRFKLQSQALKKDCLNGLIELANFAFQSLISEARAKLFLNMDIPATLVEDKIQDIPPKLHIVKTKFTDPPKPLILIVLFWVSLSLFLSFIAVSFHSAKNDKTQ